MAFALPARTEAFSFSSLFGSAAQADSSAVVPDGSLALLAAATNADPNPDKGQTDITMTGGAALIPEAGPEGAAPDVVTVPQTTAISTYTVQDGDTLSGIAAQFDVSTNTILWANNLTASSVIKPGMSLTILPVSGIQHTVVKGETLASLATKYGADATEIATYNGLASSAALPAGSTIIIPGGELAIAAPAKKSSSSSSSSVKQGGGLTSLKAEPYIGGSGAPVPGYFGNPLPGGIITQSIHGWNAVDIGAHTGTPIYAAADGTVIVSRYDGLWNGGYGNYVVISHANGTQTLYAHMSKVAASIGATVAKGTLIGYVGMTGEATGPHLHFEVRGAANPFRNCPVGSSCSPQ